MNTPHQNFIHAVRHLVTSIDNSLRTLAAINEDAPQALEDVRNLMPATDGITEADVVAFLERKADEIHDKTGVTYTSCTCDVARSYGKTSQLNWRVYADPSQSETDRSLERALGALVARLSPQNLAASKREQAAKLLAEAASIESQ